MSSETVDRVIDRFDFNRVRAYLTLIGSLRWPVHTTEQMRKDCRVMLEEVERDEGISYITLNGFVAVRCGDRDTLSLFYPLEIYEE